MRQFGREFKKLSPSWISNIRSPRVHGGTSWVSIFDWRVFSMLLMCCLAFLRLVKYCCSGDLQTAQNRATKRDPTRDLQLFQKNELKQYYCVILTNMFLQCNNQFYLIHILRLWHLL
ncbi:Hypothetical_protein [Hexamita inflata]|uniref:Hypothetical_protein n=1 Tax=Hexamita inflata TaxID=28002 RepID=A0AA86QN10_9EUKA|nr:Hypothetical protein HINF_LOCUS47232 [Hexamita inflata]